MCQVAVARAARLLGVSRGATAAEAKAAFRQLAKTWHPDKHQGGSKGAAEERFKELQAAYETLVEAGPLGGSSAAGPAR